MMRAGWVILLLVASHGAALWLGARRHGEEVVEMKKEEASPSVAAVDGRTQFRDLLESAAAREMQRVDAEAAEAELDYDEKVELARGRIAADADLRAMLEAGTIDPTVDFTPETVAALGLWFDRDAMAALRWVAAFYKEHGGSEFDGEIARYFARGGIDQLPRLVDAEPAVRGYLIACVAMMLAWDESVEAAGGARILKVAANLPAGADRTELLTKAFLRDPGRLEGNLAAIRALLDRSGAGAFLQEFHGSRYGGLLEEIRAARFPEAAVSAFVGSLPSEPSGESRGNIVDGMLEDRGNTDFVGGVPGQVDGVLPEIPAKDLQERELGRLVRVGRATPAEYYAYLKSTRPAGSAEEASLVKEVLNSGMQPDPVGTVAWLREAYPDWRQELDERYLSFLPPEMVARMAADFPEGDTFTEKFRAMARNTYERWADEDPEACWQSIRSQPPGPLRDLLMKIGEKDEEDDGYEEEDSE